MALTNGSVSSTMFVSFAVIVGIYFIKWFVQRWRLMNIFRNNGIPSVPGASMMTGNLSEFTGDDVKLVSKWLAKHGDVFGYFFGCRPTLIVKDLDVVKHVLVKDFSNFRDRPGLFVNAKPICYSVAFVNGPRWKEARNMLSPCFSSKKLRLMHDLVNDSVSTFLEILGKKSATNESFDIVAITEALSMDVINKCVLAIKNDCQKNPEDKLFVAVKKGQTMTFNNFLKLPVAFPVISTILTFISQITNSGREIETNLKSVVAFRKKNVGSRYVDMLQVILDAANGKNGDQKSAVKSSKNLLTDDEIIGNAMAFIIPGFGTTALAMTITFYLLAKHQDVQDKLRKEINENFSKDFPNTFDAINSLDYLDQVLNESLRMYPPVTTFVGRQCVSTTTINGLTIPKGVTVEVPVFQIHHDPKYWPDPESFDPSRFSAENKHKIQPMTFLPFGTGPRNCIGMKFALMEAKLSICRVIQKYRFVFSEKTEDPLSICGRFGAIYPVNRALFLNAVEL